ncbi:hypothetical protein CALVIDRAFT_601164 [Calocera viscosa TUFC12733]|uniref:CID domain-containing protein n=1 Tax=Calocera viscosa (strain TUFC12733) TaxID=1330018 RepID=A0A167IRJ9_CALVF|nr:hypothetical protein CALVIDRAFT_601164 [Calocera viscosa TUFC12733]
MADLQGFEKELKEVVYAKRLSSSKINKLTELCLKSIEHDTQLVSLLYRTHKGLPTSQKVFSLYSFDALARAARHLVVKNNITVDPMGTKGNCATFLNKVEGVLDSLVEDMLSSGQKELREKTKKILDIWTTNNTFSKETLAGLSAKVKTAEDQAAALAAAPQSTTPTTVPPPNIAPAVSPPANAAQAAGVQQALLALLSQAAAAKGATPPANTTLLGQATVAAPSISAAGIGIDAARILQQLAGQVQNQTQPSVPLAIPLVIPAAVPAAPSPPPKPMPIYAPNLPPPPDQMAAQRALGGAMPVRDRLHPQMQGTAIVGTITGTITGTTIEVAAVEEVGDHLREVAGTSGVAVVAIVHHLPMVAVKDHAALPTVVLEIVSMTVAPQVTTAFPPGGRALYALALRHSIAHLPAAIQD